MTLQAKNNSISFDGKGMTEAVSLIWDLAGHSKELGPKDILVY